MDSPLTSHETAAQNAKAEHMGSIEEATAAILVHDSSSLLQKEKLVRVLAFVLL